jgi:hypothetical protein
MCLECIEVSRTIAENGEYMVPKQFMRIWCIIHFGNHSEWELHV